MPSLASSTVNTSSVKSVIKSVDKLASYCYAGRSALPVPRVASVTCRARAESSVTEAIKIDGIRRSYCNEFVCTSSPAMEETVRAVARDLTEKFSFTASRFSPEVRYSDGLLRAWGQDGVKELTFNASNLEHRKGFVVKISMIEGSSDRAEIQYVIDGKIKGMDVTLECVDVIKLNVLTGRVEQHSSSWGARGPGAPVYVAMRTAWALQLMASQLMRTIGSKETGTEGSNGTDIDYRGMPTDPTRFFNRYDQNDANFQDAVSYAAVLGVLWLLFRAYQELERLS